MESSKDELMNLSSLDLRVEDVNEAAVEDDLRRVSEDAAAPRHAGLPHRRVRVPQGRLDGWKKARINTVVCYAKDWGPGCRNMR